MKNQSVLRLALLAVSLSGVSLLVACNHGKPDPKAEAPPPATVEPDMDANNFKVDHPDQFPLVTAIEHKAAPALNVTGVVQPDIARSVPVISIAAGRVVELKARLGDTVKKGQLLLRVQSADVSGAYQTYLKAVNDERLTRLQLERAQTLFDKGATAKSALEQAEGTEADAKTDLNAATEQLSFSASTKTTPLESSTSSPLSPASSPTSRSPMPPASRDSVLPTPSPFLICPMSGLSATFTKMISTPCMSDNMPTFI